MSKDPNDLLSYDAVIQKEDEYLVKRRAVKRGQEEADELDDTRFGIALSGGGIRSATINLGLLRTLNTFKVLEKSDYLSTVSGGGYTGSYVQATLKNEGDKSDGTNVTAYSKLFKEDHINYMRSRGEYMMPGSGGEKYWNILVLLVGYITSTLMSWISPIIFLLLAATLFAAIGELGNLNVIKPFWNFIQENQLIPRGLMVLATIFVVHFFCNVYYRYHLGVSRTFNRVETAIAVLGIILVTMIVALNVASIKVELFKNLELGYRILLYVAIALGAILLGF